MLLTSVRNRIIDPGWLLMVVGLVKVLQCIFRLAMDFLTGTMGQPIRKSSTPVRKRFICQMQGIQFFRIRGTAPWYSTGVE
jgi:hypothetical protein